MSTNPVIPFRVVSKGNPFTRRKRLWLAGGKKCHWCQSPTRLSDDHAWDAATVEHIIPRYRGGTNDDDNLVSACNRCNNRRNHEDILKLPEGALLGQYKVNSKNPQPPPNHSNPSPNMGRGSLPPKHVALTKDDKKALMAKMNKSGPTHLEQRDQALKEIAKLRDELGKAHSEGHLQRILMGDKDMEMAALKARVSAMTVWDVLRSRVARWILR